MVTIPTTAAFRNAAYIHVDIKGAALITVWYLFEARRLLEELL